MIPALLDRVTIWIGMFRRYGVWYSANLESLVIIAGKKLLALITCVFCVGCTSGETNEEPTCEINIVESAETFSVADPYEMLESASVIEVGETSMKNELFTIGACRKSVLINKWAKEACGLGANAMIVTGTVPTLPTTDGLGGGNCPMQAKAKFYVVKQDDNID